ncbi:ZN592 protein, partial [Polypterus senegalus]
MGDMKTPDFDDLLAAFDIPDATGLDAKEAIQSNSDEVEGHIKPAGMCVDENIVIAPDVPVVSVIVKNTSRQDSLESCPEKDSSPFGQNILQNGFQSPDHIPDCQNATQSTYDSAFMNGSSSSSLLERNAVQHTDTMPSFSQFSPISSPEPDDSEISNAVVHKPADFPVPSLFDTSECSVLDNQKNIADFNMFDQCYMNDAKSESANIPDKDCEIHWDEPVTVEDKKTDTVKQHAKKKDFHGMDLLPLSSVDSDLDEPVKVIESDPNLSLLAPSRHHIKSENSKFSSCLAALAALNSEEVDTVMDEPPLITREVSVSLKEVKISPKISKSPKSPRSPLEVVKRCATKQPDSPVSICSESSSKASPSVTAGSPPAIPKVRIKTIKTSSGLIKRTVTSVLPDSEQEDLQSPPESSPLQYPALEYSALNVTPSSSPSLSSHENTSHSEKIKTPKKHSSTFVIPSNENQKLSNRKQERCEKTPEATTASLLCNGNSNSTVSSPNVVQQNQMTSTLSTANLLPKAVHLANLNLVPHSVAASVTARSAAQRQNQTQLTTQVVCSTVPLVHQVKKAASTPVPTFPNAVVVALNKLLNSANPVPLYVPNLNPPAECNIHLPTRGYRCLECGDSFGLEKSLAQHYGRRSMHIEVACNHCAKTLLFYNKCSLLAHAREHKTKGIVMQCSQLFMKPIPPEQMFASTSAFSSVTSALQATPITSNSSVPETVANTEPVMPLYPEKVTQRGFKCLDCNKQAPDYPALASHYQKPGQSGWKLYYQVLNFGMIVSSALMIWKGLMVITGSESPIVVVLRENGDIKFLTKGDNNAVDDRGLYKQGQHWLEKKDVVGRARG